MLDNQAPGIYPGEQKAGRTPMADRGDDTPSTVVVPIGVAEILAQLSSLADQPGDGSGSAPAGGVGGTPPDVTP